MRAIAKYLGGLNIDVDRVFNVYPKAAGLEPSRIQDNVVYLHLVGLHPDKVINREPRVLDHSIDLMKESIEYVLRQGLVDIPKVGNREPLLLLYSVAELEKRLVFLQDLGLDAVRTLQREPCVLRYDTENMQRVARFLRDRGLTGVLPKLPRVFGYNLENNIKPKAAFLLEDMGRSAEEVNKHGHVFKHSLLGRIKPRHQYLQHLGVTRRFHLHQMYKCSDEQFAKNIAKKSLDHYMAWMSQSGDFLQTSAAARQGDPQQ